MTASSSAGSGLKNAGAAHAKPRPRAPAEPLTMESMRASIAEVLKQPAASIGDEENLIGRGLESIAIMTLTNVWMRSGVRLTFPDLFENPTLAHWWRLARAEQHGAAPALLASADAGASEDDEGAPFELGPMQQAYWIGSRQHDDLGGVNAHYYVELDGERVDAEPLEDAVRALIRRHPMLRARFLPDGRQQVMRENQAWRGLTVHDHRELEPGEVARRLADLRRELSRRRMAVEHGEVFDFQLSRLPGGKTRLHLNLEMLVCDARSFQVLCDDLVELFEGRESTLPPIRYSFRRYLAEQARRRGEQRERARSYWRERIPSMPGAPELPLLAAHGDFEIRQYGRREHRISPETRAALAGHARAAGVTLPAVLAAAFAEVLKAWSAQPRFLLNLPLFERAELHPDMPLVVGDFSNVLILCLDLSEPLPFEARARCLQLDLARDAAHAEYSGIEVLRELARARPGDRMLAPVVFTSVIGMGDLFSEKVRRCLGAPVWISSQTPQVWLDQQVTEYDGGLSLNWDVVESLFAPGVVDAMFEAYIELLGTLSRSASAWTAPCPSLLPKQQAAVRAKVNATERPLPNRWLHTAFFAHAESNPERCAVAWGGSGKDDGASSMTYGELSRWALDIAGLLRSRGIVPGDTVAITMSRGPHQVAAVLGVLAAGATFLPVGIEQPPARRAQIHQEMNAKRVLTRAAEQEALDFSGAPPQLTLEEAQQTNALPAPLEIGTDALAYVIATSGSTGTPKGIEMSHTAALNTIDDINQRFSVGSSDRVLAISALDFDLSIYDIFGLLSAGGALVLVDDEQRREPARWLALVRRWSVTLWNSVPAIFDMLLTTAESRNARELASLRLALLSGDWVSVDLPDRLFRFAPACRFVALGGATEAAIWSIAFEIGRPHGSGETIPASVDPAWRSIPYGFPLGNQQFRVVDAQGRDCPDWVPGELWIGGLGIARGYRADPERSADRFVEHAGERWYRTGDLGRYWPDGTLEFLGRTDHQIKIRGHRIELGEIEAAVQDDPRVERAVALAVGPDRNRIALAVVPKADQRGAVSEGEIWALAAAKLPPYMVPDTIVLFDRLPLTPNGKLDRRAIGELAERAQSADAIGANEVDPPANLLETEIAHLWQECLGLPQVGRGQSFFALGGDSLTATRLLESTHRRFGVELSHRQFLASPTVRDLARAIEQGRSEVEEGTL